MTRRYSEAVAVERRAKNFEKWRSQALAKHGGRFDYTQAQKQFTNQRTRLQITCSKHGTFSTTPSQHLSQDAGGCTECGKRLKKMAALRRERAGIEDWIEQNFPDHLELLDEVESGSSNIRVRCIIHGAIKLTTVSYLKNNKLYGCDECSREATVKSRKLTTRELADRYQESLPDHIHILARLPNEFSAEMKCDLHGVFTCNITSLRTGVHLCPECTRANAGYTSTRMLNILDGVAQSRKAWLGIMSVEVFGIESVKIGVTVRTLEQRYKWHLKKIHYAVQLDELTAYTFEQTLLSEMGQHIDRRILNAGMREGSRWGGDTECIYPSHLKTAINKLKSWVDGKVFTVEMARSAVPHAYEKVSEIDTSRDKDLTNRPLPIIGFDPKTLTPVVQFDSIAEAGRRGYPNVSMALSGKRRSAGGLLWLRAEEDNEVRRGLLAIQADKPKRTTGKPVRCIESGNIYRSAIEAAEVVNQFGFNASASHIISVCNGSRSHTGGLTWEQVDIDPESITAEMQSNPTPVSKISPLNLKKRVEAYCDATGEALGAYESQAAAARANGLSGASVVSVAIKKKRSVKGIRFVSVDRERSDQSIQS